MAVAALGHFVFCGARVRPPRAPRRATKTEYLRAVCCFDMAADPDSPLARSAVAAERRRSCADLPTDRRKQASLWTGSVPRQHRTALDQRRATALATAKSFRIQSTGAWLHTASTRQRRELVFLLRRGCCNCAERRQKGPRTSHDGNATGQHSGPSIPEALGAGTQRRRLPHGEFSSDETSI